MFLHSTACLAASQLKTLTSDALSQQRTMTTKTPGIVQGYDAASQPDAVSILECPHEAR